MPMCKIQLLEKDAKAYRWKCQQISLFVLQQSSMCCANCLKNYQTVSKYEMKIVCVHMRALNCQSPHY